MTYHGVYNESKTMGATSGAGTAYLSGAPEFTPVFSGIHVSQSLVFCVLFCRSLLIVFLFFFAIVVVIVQ